MCRLKIRSTSSPTVACSVCSTASNCLCTRQARPVGAHR
jgi:hypothetical protein